MRPHDQDWLISLTTSPAAGGLSGCPQRGGTQTALALNEQGPAFAARHLGL